MAEQYFVLNQGTLVLEVWKGTFTLDDVIAQQKRKLNDPRILPQATFLSDLRLADMPLPNEQEVAEVVNTYQDDSNATNYAKAVVVVPDDGQFKAAVEFQEQAKPIGLQTVVLSNMESACDMLKIPLDRIQQLVDSVPMDMP